MSMKCSAKMESKQPLGGQGRSFSGSHMPERSGRPSGVRGVGASRLGVPSDVVGTPRVGYSSHCALTGRILATALAITTDHSQVLIMSSTIRRLIDRQPGWHLSPVAQRDEPDVGQW